MALPGVFPPVERDGNRLVDGLALAPVPTKWVADAGADIVVAVNLIARDVLDAWPGKRSEAETRRPSGSRILDTLLEVMELAQLEASIRHAAVADVVVTPRFGPATWRDFHLADHFLVAGREAALEAIPQLRALTIPTT
jgi:NTE family protein